MAKDLPTSSLCDTCHCGRSESKALDEDTVLLLNAHIGQDPCMTILLYTRRKLQNINKNNELRREEEEGGQSNRRKCKGLGAGSRKSPRGGRKQGEWSCTSVKEEPGDKSRKADGGGAAQMRGRGRDGSSAGGSGSGSGHSKAMVMAVVMGVVRVVVLSSCGATNGMWGGAGRVQFCHLLGRQRGPNRRRAPCFSSSGA